MQRLHRTGMVVSRRGARGGYRLAKRPEDITILAVIEAMQGPIITNACFDEMEICSRAEWCPVRDKLNAVQSYLSEQLGEVRLSDVAGHPPGDGAGA